MLGPSYGMPDLTTCDLGPLDYVKVVRRRLFDPRICPDRA